MSKDTVNSLTKDFDDRIDDINRMILIIKKKREECDIIVDKLTILTEEKSGIKIGDIIELDNGVKLDKFIIYPKFEGSKPKLKVLNITPLFVKCKVIEGDLEKKIRKNSKSFIRKNDGIFRLNKKSFFDIIATMSNLKTKIQRSSNIDDLLENL